MSENTITKDRAILHDWMAFHDLSTHKAAAALGCAQSFLWRWLHHKRELSPRMMVKWAEAIAPRARFPRKHESIRRALFDGAIS